MTQPPIQELIKQLESRRLPIEAAIPDAMNAMLDMCLRIVREHFDYMGDSGSNELLAIGKDGVNVQPEGSLSPAKYVAIKHTTTKSGPCGSIEYGFVIKPCEISVVDEQKLYMLVQWVKMECQQHQNVGTSLTTRLMDKIRPYLRTSKPVSVERCKHGVWAADRCEECVKDQPDEYAAFQEALKSWNGPDDEMNQYHADEGALYWLWGQATKWAMATKRESSDVAAMYVYKLYSTDMSDIAELAFDRFLSIAKNAHTIDIILRADAQEHRFQGDVLKYLRKSLNVKAESYALVDCDIAACNCGGKHRRSE